MTTSAATAAARPTCDRPWCEGYREPGAPAPAYDCRRLTRHSGRVWHFDGHGFRLTVSSVEYFDADSSKPTQGQLLLSVENTEMVEHFSQGLSLAEFDGLLETLTRSRDDLATTLGWIVDEADVRPVLRAAR